MAMTGKFRPALEQCVSNFWFRGYFERDIQKYIDISQYQMKGYFARNMYEIALIDMLYGIIRRVAKKEKVDFSKYTDTQLWDMITLLRKECQGGGYYMYNNGLDWCGLAQAEELERLYCLKQNW